MTISVCWYEGIAGLYASEGVHGRSRYACTGLLNDCFDQYDCQHYSGWSGLPKNTESAVVVIHGGHLRNQVEEINQNIANLQAVICIIIGDEEADFREQDLRHRNMKIWRQSPIPGKSKADRYPIVGYPCDCRELLVHGQERKLDFFFAGQVTHARRHECVEELRKLQTRGELIETQQFYSGIPHTEYFRVMGQAKIIPCPSGPVCADTFRMAEALEAGCIPICDEHPGWRDKPTEGFWSMVFPQGMPFPVLGSWKDLPHVMEKLLDNYEFYQTSCQYFWKQYKADYFSWLGQDLKSLGVSL